ncbi:MAG TPA: PPC domain-containing protein [Candidatus Krumholzibacteria bacterium]|nr:PPC domain-containing protein [Candidatus Krumholzibacteria bacterium]
MLVRRRGALLLALVSLFLVATAPLAEATTPDLKLQRAKQADRDGYSPSLLLRAAQIAEVEPNDIPADAQEIAVGDVVDAGVPDGDVDWFRIDASTETWVAVSTAPIDGSVTDTVLELFESDGTSLIATDDDAGVGLYSALTGITVPDDGVVYARITRFSSVGDDAYRLAVEPSDAPPAPPVNDLPETAEVLEGCNVVVQGTTVGATNQLDVLACVNPDALGGDVYYQVEVPYSYQLTIQIEPDGAFDPAAYLFADPTDPAGSCVAGIDEAFTGENETLLFTNESADELPVTLYLAIDGWDPQRAGSFSAALSCDFVVDTGDESFGSLKARF